MGCAGYLVGLKKDGSGLALECISLFFLFYGYSNKTVSFSANRDFWPGFNRGSNIFKFLHAFMKTELELLHINILIISSRY